MKGSLKNYLISGILVIVPVVATIWVLKVMITWCDGILFYLLPRQLSPEYLFGYNIPGIGLVLTFAIILLAGILARFYFGKKIIKLGDTFFGHLPFGRAIYQAIKNVLQSTLSDKKDKGRRVVFVEYPKSGSYAIGFLTGKYNLESQGTIKAEFMVFIPTAPNPTSGFLLIVPETSIIRTDMTTEEASKIIISGGLLAKKDNLE